MGKNERCTKDDLKARCMNCLTDYTTAGDLFKARLCECPSCKSNKARAL